jgi:hypothetical protein
MEDEQYEVDRIYAPAPGCWWLTRNGECIIVQQLDATADGLELSKDDYYSAGSGEAGWGPAGHDRRGLRAALCQS